MANCCSLSNTGFVTALNPGTCIVKVSTYNKKYSAICTITVVDDSTPISSSEWSTNENNILLHGSSGNVYVHSHSVEGTSSQYNVIELNSSGRWKVETDVLWITPNNDWTGNSAVTNHQISWSIQENNTNSSRIATFTATNLDTNDVSTYTVTQEVKVNESIIKLFIYKGNNDVTNESLTIGDNVTYETIRVVPKIFQNNVWSDYSFGWGGTIQSNSQYVTTISPALNGTFNQYSSAKNFDINFISERQSDANVVMQFKSNTTSPNQALSTITFVMYKNVSEINGKMDIKLFRNGVEIESIDNISKDGEEITLVVKTYRGVGMNWVENNTCSWGANILIVTANTLQPICTPTFNGTSQQFYGSQQLKIKFYKNSDIVYKKFDLSLFSVDDGSGYFSGIKYFRFTQLYNNAFIAAGEIQPTSINRHYYYNSNTSIMFQVDVNVPYKVYAKVGNTISENVIFNDTSYEVIDDAGQHIITAKLPTNNTAHPILYKFYLEGYQGGDWILLDETDEFHSLPNVLSLADSSNYVSLEYNNDLNDAADIPYIACDFDILVRSYFNYNIQVISTQTCTIERIGDNAIPNQTSSMSNVSAGVSLFTIHTSINNGGDYYINVRITSTDNRLVFNEILNNNQIKKSNPLQQVVSDYAWMLKRKVKIYSEESINTVEIPLSHNIACNFISYNCIVLDDINGTQGSISIDKQNLTVRITGAGNVGTLTLFDSGTNTEYDKIYIKKLIVDKNNYTII